MKFQCNFLIFSLFFCGIGAFNGLLHAKEMVYTKEQTAFLEAEKLVKKRQWKQLKTIESQLQDYPLTIYLQRDRLLTDLSINNRDEIDAFLNTHGDLPVARKLRYKWLHWLAKNNHSSLFLRHYRNFDSPTLKCKNLEYRFKTAENQRDLYPQAKNLWLTGRSLPKACDKLFKQLTAEGFITEDLIWQRFQLAVKARQKSLANYLSKKLSPRNQSAAALFVKLAKNPEKLADIKFRSPLSDKAEEIIHKALYQLAWDDPNKAIQIWKDLGKAYQLDRPMRNVKRAISLSLAIDKDAKASDWLASLNWQTDESVNQWLLSTAISEQNWQLIADLANEFSHRSHEANKWLYWKAVAETQLGNLSNAEETFKQLAEQRSYYGFLAARQLGQKAQLQQRTLDFDTDELTSLEEKPAAIRAKEFLALGRLNDARREWNYLVSRTNHQDQAKLALIAHRWKWQHQAILAFARSKQIDDVEKRFPLHHLALYQQQSKKNQIPLSWAYAITRQESAFKTDAISSAGARGLMQLKPSTARMVAKSKKLFKRPSQLLNADTNVKLGTAHLSNMYQSFNAHPVLATAAYNAGKRRVQQWLENNNTRDAIQWIEQIPYKETREYVKNVLTYQLIYARLTNQPDDFIAQIDNYPIVSNNILTKK